MKTKFSYHIGQSKAKYYYAKTIYILAVDRLNSLQDVKDKEASNFSLLLKEMLQKCKVELVTCLNVAILHYSKMEHNTLAFFQKKKETQALNKARMEFTLLYRKDYTVQKGKDLLIRKRLGYSKLSFSRFISFSVKREGEKLQFFKCNAKTILLGNVSIEETKAEDKAAWEVIVQEDFYNQLVFLLSFLFHSTTLLNNIAKSST